MKSKFDICPHILTEYHCMEHHETEKGKHVMVIRMKKNVCLGKGMWRSRRAGSALVRSLLHTNSILYNNE